MTDLARAVLGSMFNGWIETSEFQTPEFEMPAHRLIHGAISRIRESGATPDLMLVRHELEDDLDPSWQTELMTLDDYALAKSNAPIYAQALRRSIQQVELRKMTMALMGDLESGDIPENLQTRLQAMQDLSQTRNSRGPTHVGEGLAEMFLTGNVKPVPLGLECLSRMRVQEGNVCVIGARPGCGKTAMLGTIAVNAARAGWQVLFLSLEMPEIQIRQRMLAMDSGMPLETIMLADDPAMIGHAQKLLRLPIWIEDRAQELTLERIFAMVRAFAHTHADRQTVVLIDYLQLIRTSARYDRRYELIGHVCRTLKHLSLNSETPIIVAAQLSRAAESRGKDSRPQMSDLRESGEIEQVADQVILMHRELDKTLLKVAKYRMGPTFTTECRFVGEQSYFEDFGWQ